MALALDKSVLKRGNYTGNYTVPFCLGDPSLLLRHISVQSPTLGLWGLLWDYLIPEEGSLFRSCLQSRGQFCICNCLTLRQSLDPSNPVVSISESCVFFPGQCLSAHICLTDSKGIYFKYPFISSLGKLPNSLLFPSQIIFLQMVAPGPCEILVKTFNPSGSSRMLYGCHMAAVRGYNSRCM